MTFSRFPDGYVAGWHNASRRQYVIVLSGEMEIEIGDGTVRRLGPGEMVLGEDLTGQGHITRCLGDHISVIVPLGD